jgi:chromosome segregation ATPase
MLLNQLIDVRSLAAIPNELSAAKQYVKTNEAEIVATIKAMEVEKRQALETIALRREAAIQRASEYYGRILDKQARLRRQMLTLEAQKNQSAKDIKRVEEQADRFQKVLTDFDIQRKQMVSRVRAPGWSVAHHYHLTALDHFEGKLQPALIDVGSMMYVPTPLSPCVCLQYM